MRCVSLSTTIRVAALIGVACLGACGGHGAGASADTTAVATVAATVVPVQVQPFAETITALGVVEPRAGHVATLGAPAPARVAAVLVSTGDHVQRDQPLVRFDASGFDAATRSANAAVIAAQQAQGREQRLVREGIAARKDLEQADADLARARADSVAAWRVADRATLRAPIAGVVTRMTASLGADVDATQPLVEIADPSALDVVLTVTPELAAQVHAGAVVSLFSGTTTAVGRGTVTDVAGAVDSATRGVPLRVRVESTRRLLRLGESLSGKIVTATLPHAITVPVLALVPAGDGFQVFVVDNAGIAHATPVAVGGRTESVAEITHGLAPGDRVVSVGAFGVDDGAKIVSPSAATAPAQP